jgi:two-component system, OmpR family, sensor kinase
MVNLARRLRRMRLALALQFAAVAAVVALLFANMIIHHGVTRIDNRRDAQAERQIADVLRKFRQDGQKLENSPTWFVDTENGTKDPFSDSGLEPPLIGVMRAAGNNEASDTFTQGGKKYFAYARAITENQGYVTVVDTTDFSADKTSLRRKVFALALLSTLGAAAIGWVLAARAVGPARRALADQQGFLADAAHELRTPLSVILASASQALSRPRSTEEYVRSLSEIRSASERASAGVSQLLDLARFDSGQVIPRLAPLRLDLLAEEVAASIRTDDCTIIAEPGAEAVVVDADMALLRQAVDNVVSNAVRRATSVRLTTRIEGRDGIIEISDDGPGFDEAVLSQVFDRNRRGDTRGNAGIGLAIVQSIVAAHGGAAEAANLPAGGAVVRLRVPRSVT